MFQVALARYKSFRPAFFKFFSSILCLLTCRALFKIFHQTKDDLKVFCLLFFKFFLLFPAKLILRVFRMCFKLLLPVIKVFAQPFSKGWLLIFLFKNNRSKQTKNQSCSNTACRTGHSAGKHAEKSLFIYGFPNSLSQKMTESGKRHRSPAACKFHKRLVPAECRNNNADNNV